MARTRAALPKGARLTDYISLGVLSKAFPLKRVRRVLAATGTVSQRQRDLPAHVVVYYVIALALYMQVSSREVLRCLLEGLQWLAGPTHPLKITGKSGISQARTRVGWAPLKRLHDEVVRPVAAPATQGAWFRDWRLVTLDGSTLDVADTRANVHAFGRPAASRGASAFPQIRFVSLVENGTHVLFGTQLGRCQTGEITLARDVVPALQPGMLCLADRMFFGWALWEAGPPDRGGPPLAGQEASAVAGAGALPGWIRSQARSTRPLGIAGTRRMPRRSGSSSTRCTASATQSRSIGW